MCVCARSVFSWELKSFFPINNQLKVRLGDAEATWFPFKLMERLASGERVKIR